MDQYASWKLALDSRKMWKGFLFVYRHIYMFRISYVRIDVCVYTYIYICDYVHMWVLPNRKMAANMVVAPLLNAANCV